jgi:two-component system, OmpR family, response regulator
LDAQVVEPSSLSESSTRTLDPLRVFLVEDSAVIRERLTETISSIEHVEVVGHAETEADAIAALQAAACDAVVLDLQLREGHGFNVLKALRSTSARRRVIVLVLSNYATPQYRGRSMEIGADYFFDKSREYDRLCEVLEELVARRTRETGPETR